jgi:hypothetical protein
MKKIQITANQGEERKYYEYYQEGERQIVTPRHTPENGGAWYWAYVTVNDDRDSYTFDFNGERGEIERNFEAVDE